MYDPFVNRIYFNVNHYKASKNKKNIQALI